MLYLISCILLFLVFNYKRNNKLALCMSLFIFILVGWSYGNADYQIHLRRFTQYATDSWQTEPLYSLVMKMFNRLGLSYRVFLVVFAFIFLFFNYKLIKKYSRCTGYILGLYLIFPLCMDVTMVRYSFATIFLTIGMSFLLDENDDRWLIKYLFCVLLATACHSATILALLFIPAKYLDTKKIVTITSAAICFLYVFIGSLKLLSSKLMNITIFNFGTKINIALKSAEMKYTSFDILKYSLKVAILFFIYCMLHVMIERYFTKMGVDKRCKERVFMNTILKINILTLLIIPLLSLSPDLFRLQLYLSVINYISLTKYQDVKIKIGSKPTTLLQTSTIAVGILLYSFVGLYFWVLSGPNINTVFRPLFENNIIFSWGK